MGFSETMNGKHNFWQIKVCPGYSSFFYSRVTPASPPVPLVPSLGKQPPLQPPTSLGTHGLGGAGAISEKHPAKNASLSQGQPRKTLGQGREIRQALRLGHRRGRRRRKAKSGTR